MHELGWTSEEPLEGERLAYFGVIPLAAFVGTFWLLVVGHPMLFAAVMVASVIITTLVVRNRKGTRITIDDESFRYGKFQRVSLKYISSARIKPAMVGSSDILIITTRGDEGESFSMKCVPDDVRARILEILERRLNAT